MRSIDEQYQEIMRRAKIVKEKRIIRKHVYAGAIASCVCAALLIAVCFCLPQLTATQGAPGMQQYGSLLLAAPYTGYVAVGVLAFALGICVTLLCTRWKALKKKEKEYK